MRPYLELPYFFTEVPLWYSLQSVSMCCGPRLDSDLLSHTIVIARQRRSWTYREPCICAFP